MPSVAERSRPTRLKATIGLTCLGLWAALGAYTATAEARNARHDNLRRIESCIDYNANQLAKTEEITPEDVIVASTRCFRFYSNAEIPDDTSTRDIEIRKIHELTGVDVAPSSQSTD